MNIDVVALVSVILVPIPAVLKPSPSTVIPPVRACPPFVVHSPEGMYIVPRPLALTHAIASVSVVERSDDPAIQATLNLSTAPRAIRICAVASASAMICRLPGSIKLLTVSVLLALTVINPPSITFKVILAGMVVFADIVTGFLTTSVTSSVFISDIAVAKLLL